MRRIPLPLRVERHPLGPRCHVAGVRVHEWHAGLALVAAGVAGALSGAVGGWLLATVLAIGTWLFAKDWHDLVPSMRDSAAWSPGIHRPPAVLRQRPPGSWLPPIAALLTGAAGVMNILSALTPDLPGRVSLLLSSVPSTGVVLASAAALPAGIALTLVAVALGRRRRRALVVAVGLLLLLAVLNMVKGLDIEEALLSAGLAAMLVRNRAAFDAEHARMAWAVVVSRLTLIGVGATGALVAHGLVGVVCIATAALVARGLFRPLAAPGPCASRPQIASIIREYGRDTLSYFKLRGDLGDVVAPDNRAFLSYRAERGVMLIAGDPVGSPDAIPGIMSDACGLADRSGLKVAVLGASEDLLDVGRQAGLRSLYIGDEAIVDTAAFSLEGRPIRKVRQSVNRLKREGYEAVLYEQRELSPAELDELDAVSERWRGGTPERGFSMALDTIRGDHLADSLVVVARDGDGAIRGFLHLVPGGRSAMSLSAMRREPGTPNGLMEFLVVRAIEALRERGVGELSLNFAAFARWMHDPANRIEAALGRVVALANPFFQIESLHSFNAKFFPRWQPRYLLFDGALALPRTALAALTAEGFVPRLQPVERLRVGLRRRGLAPGSSANPVLTRAV
jgi:lysyl-tRNA synthetase class 2